MIKKRLIARYLVLPVIGIFLSGCVPTQASSISRDEVNRLVQAPKLQATEVEGSLKYLSNFKGTPIHLRGKITAIQHPQSSSMPDGETFEWVPVVVEVESSNQPDINSLVVIRLYPMTDDNDSLLRLAIGDEIIALTSKRSATESGLNVYTLGSLYHVLSDKSVVQFDSSQTFEGIEDDFLPLLGIN